MNLNSQFSFYPEQPDNPTDDDRHSLLLNALEKNGWSEDLDQIIRLMSPPPDITNIARPGEFKGIKVGIIGGGLAGLSAAFELRKLGFDITVYDALDDRIGGRIYTYYFNEEKSVYGEFGAMRIPVAHETVWHYLNLFRLPTKPFIQVDNNGYIYLKNTRVRNDPKGYYTMKYIYPKYNLTNVEKSINWSDLLSLGIDSHLLNATPSERSELLTVKPNYSNRTLLWDEMNSLKMMALAGLSQNAINLASSFSPLLYGNLYNSYIDYAQAEYPANLEYLYEIPGGMVKFPQAFYNSLMTTNPSTEYMGITPNCIGNVCWKSGCYVNGIYYNKFDNKVKLQYEQKKNIFDESFDYIVCTIPFSSLRNIEIDPLFSNVKMRAIRELNYTTAQKTLLLCNQRFWEKDGIVGGSSITDLPINSIWYPSDHSKFITDFSSLANLANNPITNLPGVIIGSFNFTLDTTRLTNIPEEKRFEMIKRQIELVHGLPKGYLDSIVECAKTVNWDKEEAFRGSICYFTSQQKALFSYGMALPEYNGKVFFAGEHISAVHRWMQGSLQSGMQASNALAATCKTHMSYHL